MGVSIQAITMLIQAAVSKSVVQFAVGDEWDGAGRCFCVNFESLQFGKRSVFDFFPTVSGELSRCVSSVYYQDFIVDCGQLQLA